MSQRLFKTQFHICSCPDPQKRQEPKAPSSGTFCSDRPVTHLADQTNMQKQNPKQVSLQTGPTQKSILPQVRYHPSIQAAGGGASAKPSSQKPKPSTARRPRTRTKPDTVQENQDSNRAGSAVRPEPDKDVNSVGDGAPPRPEQVPLVISAHLDRCLVDRVEVLTRGQSTNPAWFTWRKNRITASVAHRIAHCRFVHGKSKAPPLSYLAAVTGDGPRVQTRAMSWGIKMESEAVRRYQTLKTAALGRPVLVQDCGLFIDTRRPWLAASPDGIVTDRRTGQWLLCLEVKCPFKHRDRRVEDACRDDPAFCLQIEDEDGRNHREPPVYRLKTSHSYFTQIQCQLAVTGLKRADLVVFTLKETAVVPVTFDPELWDETVSKLEVFYRDAVLPHVQPKTQQDAAARRPEL
ncbi:uncharacterized protein LOC108229003 [Kryptolebias marmoratus]|uniref:Uncharacterized LOC108229003 n=1 Tax=Kryptolebias marmoratus TaxID=37003 RepID=A0A3Q3AD84_KRYMA|nr:uncharacterized protein LOC108229003 [Kryptolebias marmoratus]